MTTSKQFFGILLLVFGVIIVTHAVYSITLFVLPRVLAFALGFVVAPLLLAAIVYWRGYFSDLGYTTTEEYLFSPYYAVSPPNRLKVIGGIGLLGLLPVMVTALVVPEFEAPWVDSYPFGMMLMVYGLTVLGYGAILFEPARSIYRRGMAPMLIVFGGLIAAYGLYASDPVGVEGWGVILISIGAVYCGAILLLRASRTIADTKSKAESEIAFAGEVQRQFLQSTQVDAGRSVAYASSQPARQLGGDFFHLSRSADDRLVAAVGDVSGHSFGAGLIMTMLKTSFENFVRFEISADELLDRLNSQLLGQTRRSVFASLACIELDTRDGSGLLWNAGHMPLLRYHGKTARIEELRPPGLALGLSGEATYAPQAFQLQPGDWLILYSDGLVETRDSDGEVRSIEYFAALVQRVLSAHEAPTDVAEEITSRIHSAHAQPLLNDDTTLIVVKFESG